MYDGASGKIKSTQITNPTPRRPYPMRQRSVNEQEPQRGEDRKSAKLHALRKGPGNEGRRNRREKELKHSEGDMWNRWRQSRIGQLPDAAKASVAQTTNKVMNIRAKGQRVADQHPEHRYKTERKETL